MMPPFGKNSSGPGNFWVVTSSGWQKVSSLRENLECHQDANGRVATNNEANFHGSNDNTASSSSIDCAATEPVPQTSNDNALNKQLHAENPEAHYMFIPVSTVLNEGYLTVAEVLCKLDLIVTALNNQRRFRYIIKFLELIVEHQFMSLSGSAFKYLFFALEEAVNTVKSTNQNLRRVIRLLEMTKQKTINNRYVLVGSTVLYNSRIQQLTTWVTQLKEHPLPEREDDGRPTLDTLPIPCKRLILRMLADPADIERLGQTNQTFHQLSQDPLLWNELFHYHYAEETVCDTFPDFEPTDDTDWKEMMGNMQKRVPLRKEEYPDVLQKCRCNCLYWKGEGHPCALETSEDGSGRPTRRRKPVVIDISPKELLDIFSKFSN